MIVGVIQCRMASTRLPGKALADIYGKPLLERVLQRSQRIEGVDQVWLATSQSPENDPLEAMCQRLGFPCFRGGEEDVIGRFAQVAKQSQATAILRLTGDNPLLDSWAIGALLQKHLEEKADYSCLTGLPVGASCDIFSASALIKTHEAVDGNKMADHLDLYILENQNAFKVQQVQITPSMSKLRLTIDHPQDLQHIRQLFDSAMQMKSMDIDSKNSFEIQQIAHALELESALRNEDSLVSKENLYTAELVGKIQNKYSFSYPQFLSLRIAK